METRQKQAYSVILFFGIIIFLIGNALKWNYIDNNGGSSETSWSEEEYIDPGHPLMKGVNTSAGTNWRIKTTVTKRETTKDAFWPFPRTIYSYEDNGLWHTKK